MDQNGEQFLMEFLKTQTLLILTPEGKIVFTMAFLMECQ